MSVSTEISRLQSSRNTIRNKLVELGLSTSTATLDALAEAIDGVISQGALSISVREGETVTIPAGYHNGAGTVSGVAGGGNYTLQSKTVTPTKKQQSITSDAGYYGLSDVVVAAIPEAYQDVSSVNTAAADVLSGKIFVTSTGEVVTGTMVNNGAVTRVLDVTTISFTIPKGYHSGTGTVSIVLETKTVTPTKAAQKVTPASGKVLSEVTVNPIPDAYQDITGTTATEGSVLDGDIFIGADGKQKTGTIPRNGDVSNTIDGLTATSVSIPAGYTTGGTVSLTDDIEEALAAI